MLPTMKRSTLVMFGIVALLFAVLIPAWAISREGGEEASPQSVPADLEEGKDLFVTNCGSCHTLYKAGTDGVVGPNLDELLAPPSPTPPDPATIQPPGAERRPERDRRQDAGGHPHRAAGEGSRRFRRPGSRRPLGRKAAGSGAIASGIAKGGGGRRRPRLMAKPST